MFYSVGTSRSVPTDLKSGAPTVTITAGLATFTIAQPNNVGVGDEIMYGGATLAYISGRLSSTRYTVTNRLGVAPADVAGATVNRIYRAFASLSLAVAGSSNGTHLGTTDPHRRRQLSAQLALLQRRPMDDQVVISGYTTGPANYIRVYTPVDDNEVGASQAPPRGLGGTGFRLEPTSAVTRQVARRLRENRGNRDRREPVHAQTVPAECASSTLATSPVEHSVSHNII